MKKTALLISTVFSLVSANALAVPKAAETEHGTVTSAPATAPVPKKEKASIKKSSKPVQKSTKSTKSKTPKKNTSKNTKATK